MVSIQLCPCLLVPSPLVSALRAPHKTLSCAKHLNTQLTCFGKQSLWQRNESTRLPPPALSSTSSEFLGLHLRDLLTLPCRSVLSCRQQHCPVLPYVLACLCHHQHHLSSVRGERSLRAPPRISCSVSARRSAETLEYPPS